MLNLMVEVFVVRGGNQVDVPRRAKRLRSALCTRSPFGEHFEVMTYG